MAQNLILPFATGTGANVVSDQAWAVYAALAQGFQAGPAPSAGVNKALRQSTAVASGFGQFVADFSAIDFTDSLSPQAMRDNFRLAFAAAMDGARMGADTSATANAITFPLTPLPPSLSGNKVIWFRPNLTNTGACTATILKSDGTAAFATLPIKTRTGIDPASGDLVANVWYASTCDGAAFRLLAATNSEIRSLISAGVGDTIFRGSATQGTSSALTTTLANAPTSAYVGMLFTAPITTTCAASATIDFGYGPKPIVVNQTGSNSVAGALPGGVGYVALFVYDGTNARVLGPAAQTGIPGVS